jgi:hypothetical protein
MNAGPQLRRGLKMLFAVHGGPVLIHRNWQTPEVQTTTVRGIKGDDFFEFLDKVDVRTGDILQQDGSRNFWRVAHVEDNINGTTFLSLRAHVSNDAVPAKSPRVANVTIQGHVYGGVGLLR